MTARWRPPCASDPGLDRAKWLAYGQPVPNFNNAWLGWISHDGIDVAGRRFPPQPGYQAGEWHGPSGKDVADSLFTYPQLLALPRGPVALRARLRQAETALARRQASPGGPQVPERPSLTAYMELSDIGSLLTAPIPTSLRRALANAAITMPGAVVDRHAHDALGRPGIAVSASDGAAFQRLIFDPASGALLENAPDVAVTAQGAVGSVYALPKGVSPVHAAGSPPQPQLPTISPAAGQRATVFTVTLSPSRQQRSRRPPALDWLLIGTPGPRCFATFAPQLPPLTAVGSVTHHGRRSYTYRLTPADVHRRTWCPGRYQLLLVPADPRQPNAAYLGMAEQHRQLDHLPDQLARPSVHPPPSRLAASARMLEYVAVNPWSCQSSMPTARQCSCANGQSSGSAPSQAPAFRNDRRRTASARLREGRLWSSVAYAQAHRAAASASFAAVAGNEEADPDCGAEDAGNDSRNERDHDDRHR